MKGGFVSSLALVTALGFAGCTDDQGADDDATSDTSVAEVGTVDVEQVVFDGVTFSHPVDFVSDVQARRLGLGTSADVRFDLVGPIGPGARLVVTVLRDRAGVETERVTDESRDLLEVLDSGSLDGEELKFVNGVGQRTTGDGYHFVGLTDDDRFLVEFFAGSVEPTGDDNPLPLLDLLVSSIFVDGSVEALGDYDCEPGMELIADVPLTDGDGPRRGGDELVKSWQIRNTGDCAWDQGWSWAFTGGDAIEIVETSPIGEIAPGDEIEVSVTVRLPFEPGSYAAQWQLVGPVDRTPLGPPAVLQVEVGS